MFDFNNFSFKLSEETVNYFYPKCNFQFQATIKAVYQFEQKDEWNNLHVSTPPYTICSKCRYDKCVLLACKPLRGYLHIYKK